MPETAAPGVHANAPSMSVVIPAYNEECYIAETLTHLRAAERYLKARTDPVLQILVVDNGSTDRTVELARGLGVTVLREPDHNIAKVRNTGALVAEHDLLVFLDADTLVPPELLFCIAQLMSQSVCLGGAVDTAYRSRRFVIRFYLYLWRAVGILFGMATGACQFCRRDVFAELGGYDETLFMGEDVDFFWRLRALGRRRGLETRFIRDLQVVPSARRFDKWPLWRTLALTNPLLILLLRRRMSLWAGWYEKAPR